MLFKPESWVNEFVRSRVCELERSNNSFVAAEQSCWRRLTSDLRMKEVYSSAYLMKRLSPQGWRIWFDLAQGVGVSALKEERQVRARYGELMKKIGDQLTELSSSMRELDDLGIIEGNHPRSMYHSLELIEAAAAQSSNDGDGRLEDLFSQHIKPTLASLKKFDYRYVPSSTQIISALSEEVDIANFMRDQIGASHADPILRAALIGRQHSPLPEYVRSFDAAISMYASDVGGSDFCIPASILAIQAAAALNLNEVDKKQITSARRLAAEK